MAKLILTAFAPIEIVLGEKTYSIESLSSDLMDRFRTAARNVGTDPDTIKVGNLGDVLVEVLPGMTKEEAAKVDIRHILKIAEFLTDQINGIAEPGESKN